MRCFSLLKWTNLKCMLIMCNIIWCCFVMSNYIPKTKYVHLYIYIYWLGKRTTYQLLDPKTQMLTNDKGPLRSIKSLPSYPVKMYTICLYILNIYLIVLLFSDFSFASLSFILLTLRDKESLQFCLMKKEITSFHSFRLAQYTKRLLTILNFAWYVHI